MFLADRQPSLSRKITLGYYAIALLIVGAAALPFFELLSLETKVSLGERTSELLETTLEIRRFERNYFLHRQPADYDENRRHVALARAFLDNNRTDLAAIESPATLSRFRELLDVYERNMAGYAAIATRAGRLALAETRVRSAGKDIVAIAAEMATAEKTVVRTSLAAFREVLVAVIAGLAVLILIMSRAISRRIVGPLKTMENSVEAVSGGKMGLLQAPTADREIVSITEAFNHMLRELELRQKHLVRSEKLASMGTMLSGVAHELNNPLSNISTSCQILLEEWETADAATRNTLLAQIDEQCERARNIVRSLLDFARPGSFRRERVPLRPLFAQTLRFVRGEVPARVEVSFAVADDIAVAGDAQRLQQAFLNLIKNAVQALPGEGRVVITAVAARISGEAARNRPPFEGCHVEGDVVDVRIADNGPGIAADVLPRIFDPFFTTKDVGRGMGLGLFITHEIIEEHDGCMAVTTGAGIGTTFHVRLPAASTLAQAVPTGQPR
ncbi:MAG: HAMP domain-containing protein [Betaproteobacteria bacterium]|nr:MAG: HAMP domain-containing protein [Betaproteobacteria bacterium]